MSSVTVALPWTHSVTVPNRGRSGAGCLILARSTGRLLVNLRAGWVSEPLTWATWGGEIEPGCDPEDTVTREVWEEAGLDDFEALVPLMVYRDPEDGFRYHNYLAVIADEVVPRLNDESAGSRWVSWGRWPAPLHFGLKALLADQPSRRILERQCGLVAACAR